MKKINWKKHGLSVVIWAVVGIALPYLTQWPMTIAINQVTQQLPFFLMPYGLFVGLLLTTLWPFFWYAVPTGIVVTLWAKIETVKAWGTLGLTLVIFALAGTPVIAVGLALGIIVGLVGQSVILSLNAWARTS